MGYKVDTSGYEDTMPQNTLISLVNYAERRAPVGDFLTGMLTNDLKKALSHCDADNLKAIRSIFLLIYNRMPMLCHGSKESMHAWYNREDVSDED